MAVTVTLLSVEKLDYGTLGLKCSFDTGTDVTERLVMVPWSSETDLADVRAAIKEERDKIDAGSAILETLKGLVGQSIDIP